LNKLGKKEADLVEFVSEIKVFQLSRLAFLEFLQWVLLAVLN
jgi:hypothetical protein